MRQRILPSLIVVGCLTAVLDGRPLHRAAQVQEPLTFKASVDVVPIHASVRDRRGRPLRGLRQTDFEIFDSGIRQRIVTFEADERAPINVAFLIDVSGSMSVAGKLSLARAMVSRIVGSLHAGRDEAALFTFDSALHERHAFTRDLDAVARSFPDVEPFGNTSLYDAVAATARRVEGQATGRRAIVVMTDGTDTSSRLSAAEVSGLASSIDLPVYIIAAVAPVDRATLAGDRTLPMDGYAADLRDLADWTGGTLLVASSQLDAERQASTLVTELRHQYILGIDAALTTGWRALDVRVRVKTAVVKARSGYFGRSTVAFHQGTRARRENVWTSVSQAHPQTPPTDQRGGRFPSPSAFLGVVTNAPLLGWSARFRSRERFGRCRAPSRCAAQEVVQGRHLTEYRLPYRLLE